MTRKILCKQLRAARKIKPFGAAPAAGTEVPPSPITMAPTADPVKQEVKQGEEKPLEQVPQREPVKNQDVGRVYNQEEAANFLGVSTPTLRKYMRLGRIKFKKECNRVFFTQQHLNEFLQGGK